MVKKIKKSKSQTPLNDWWKMTHWFEEGDGMQASSKNGAPFVIQGKLEETPVVTLPTTATNRQAREIANAIEETIGVRPLVISDNVTIMRLVPASGDEVAKAMKG